MDNELHHAIRRLTAWNVGDDDICPDYTPDAAEFQVDVNAVLKAVNASAPLTARAAHTIPPTTVKLMIATLDRAIAVLRSIPLCDATAGVPAMRGELTWLRDKLLPPVQAVEIEREDDAA